MTLAVVLLGQLTQSARLLVAGALGGLDQLARAEREGWVPPYPTRAEIDTLTRGMIRPADWETPA